MRDLERRQGLTREGHLDAWENIGHVIGAGTGIIVASTLGNVAAVVGAAGGAALCTALMGIAIALRLASAGRPWNTRSSDIMERAGGYERPRRGRVSRPLLMLPKMRKGAAKHK